MSLPVFRTDPARSRQISWWACALGYLVALVGVPLAAGGLHQLAIFALKGTGVTRSFAGPVLQYGEQVVEFLTYSIVASYMGAILSVPVVIWARAKGWFGWGTAMLTGVGVAVVVLGLFFGFPLVQIFAQLSLPSALLGLAFWVTVRLCHPSVFRTAPAKVKKR